MRSLLATLTLLLLLNGCSWSSGQNAAEQLRKDVFSGNGLQFRCSICADYSDMKFCFALSCSTEDGAQVKFCALEPASIQGIGGYVGPDESAVTFDDQILAFPLMGDSPVSPVGAPWLFLQALRYGCLCNYSITEDGCTVALDFEHRDRVLRVDVGFDAGGIPQYAYIGENGHTYLTLTFSDFQKL